MSDIERILQQKAGELVARKIQSPIEPEQHLVLHWMNEEGFSIGFNLSLGLRKCPVADIFRVIPVCRKEMTRRGLKPRA